MSRYDYLRDPAAIYARAEAQVRSATDLTAVPPDLEAMALRLVHACAMPDIVAELRWSGTPGASGARALRAGRAVLVDCKMVAEGITRSRLPAGNAVVCTLDAPEVATLRARGATTRSAAAVELWPDHLSEAVVAIGNAPTALFRLLELLLDRPAAPRPAVILAFPVGFVGAAESKAALVEAALGVPYLTLAGRRGGSALAAAAVNALAGASFA